MNEDDLTNVPCNSVIIYFKTLNLLTFFFRKRILIIFVLYHYFYFPGSFFLNFYSKLQEFRLVHYAGDVTYNVEGELLIFIYFRLYL